MLKYNVRSCTYYLNNKKLSYLHPSGETEMISGHGLQKSAFLSESSINAKKIKDGVNIKEIIIHPVGSKSIGTKGLFYGSFVADCNIYNSESYCEII